MSAFRFPRSAFRIQKMVLTAGAGNVGSRLVKFPRIFMRRRTSIFAPNSCLITDEEGEAFASCPPRQVRLPQLSNRCSQAPSQRRRHDRARRRRMNILSRVMMHPFPAAGNGVETRHNRAAKGVVANLRTESGVCYYAFG